MVHQLFFSISVIIILLNYVSGKFMLSKHTLYYFFSHGVPAMIGFASIAIFTRILTPTEYGHYAIVYAISMLTYALFFEWQKLGLLRFYSKFENEPSFFQSIKLTFLFVVFWIFLIGMISAFFLLEYEFGIQYILFTLLLTTSYAWFTLNISYLRASLLPKEYGIISAVRHSLGLILGVLFIYLGFGGFGLLSAVIIGIVLSTLIPSMKYWKINKPIKHTDIKYNRLFLGYGVPLAATGLLGIIVHNSDRFIISYLLNTSSTGIYSVTYDLVEQSIFTFMMVVNLAGFPIIMKRLEKNGFEEALVEVKKNTYIMLSLSLPAMVGMIVLSKNIIFLFLGEGYRELAAILLPYIAVGAFIKGLKLYGIDILFHLTQDTKSQMIPFAIAAVINVVLNFVLIPSMGVMGAALSTLVAYIISFIITIMLVRKKARIPFPWLGFIKVLIATIIMGLILIPLSDLIGIKYLFFQVCTGLFSYLIIFGLLHRQETVTFLRRKQRRKPIN
jgi:O-antigen/teichoic acid export membrane protein